MIEEHTKETWIQANWRPAAAFIYLFICLMDFVGMPLLTFLFHKPFYSILKEISSLTPEVQQAVLLPLISAWTPITTSGNSIFHIAFGAILGVSAWGRTSEKNNKIQQMSELEKAAMNSNTDVSTTVSASDNPAKITTNKTVS